MKVYILTYNIDPWYDTGFTTEIVGVFTSIQKANERKENERKENEEIEDYKWYDIEEFILDL